MSADERWRHDARCQSTPDDEAVAMRDADAWTKQIGVLVGRYCGACPVVAQCLASVVEAKDWGVRGGQLLRNGRPAVQHRSPDNARPLSPDETADWLAAELRDGPAAVAALKAAQAATPGLSWAAVVRARQSLGVVSRSLNTQITWLTAGQERQRTTEATTWLREHLADHEPHGVRAVWRSSPEHLSLTLAEVEHLAGQIGAVTGRGLPQKGSTHAVTITLHATRHRGQRRQPKRLPRARRRRKQRAA